MLVDNVQEKPHFLKLRCLKTLADWKSITTGEYLLSAISIPDISNYCALYEYTINWFCDFFPIVITVFQFFYLNLDAFCLLRSLDLTEMTPSLWHLLT